MVNHYSLKHVRPNERGHVYFELRERGFFFALCSVMLFSNNSNCNGNRVKLCGLQISTYSNVHGEKHAVEKKKPTEIRFYPDSEIQKKTNRHTIRLFAVAKMCKTFFTSLLK